MAEIIYSGNELCLAEILIEKTIISNRISRGDITYIDVDCSFPKKDSLKLWEITITVHTTAYHTPSYQWKEHFYSKNCIEHGYSMTYLQVQRNLGVKKIKIKDIFYEED